MHMLRLTPVSSFVSHLSLLTAQGVKSWMVFPIFRPGIVPVIHCDYIDGGGLSHSVFHL